MDEQTYKDDPRTKALRQSVYQKKQALQTIFDKINLAVYPPKETLEQIRELLIVSGVYVEKQDH